MRSRALRRGARGPHHADSRPARYAVAVEPLVLTLPAVIFRVDNGIFEVFQAIHEGPMRVPLDWLSIKVDRPKHGQVFLRVGQAAEPGPVLYGQDATLAGVHRGVLISAADEPAVRALCARVAEGSGRSVQS